MADKKISEFPITTSLADDDIFLINHLGSTNTVSYNTLKSSTNNDVIKKPVPSGTNGQVLTYNGTTWIAANVPTELPVGTNGQVLTHNGTTWVGVASSQYSSAYIKAFGSVKYANGDTSGSNHSTGGGSQATEMTSSSFHNVVSVTWMERGIYRITLTNAMPNINYTVVSQIAPSNNFTFASNDDENFMDYSSPDYYHNGNENILLTFNKTTTTFDIVCWSDQNNVKENLNGFDFLVLSV
jgi:hypothetical protein